MKFLGYMALFAGAMGGILLMCLGTYFLGLLIFKSDLGAYVFSIAAVVIGCAYGFARDMTRLEQ